MGTEITETNSSEVSQPETAEQVESTETETSDQQVEETQSAEQGQEGAVESSTEEDGTTKPETDATPLPKLLQAYDSDEVAQYLERFQVTPEDLEKEPRLAYMLKSKIEADHMLAKKDQPEKEEVEEEPAQVEQPKPTPEQMKTYLDGIGQFTSRVNSPEMVSHFAKAALEAVGVNEKSENYASMLKANEAQLNVLSQAAMSMIATAFPELLSYYLSPAMEKAYSGFGDMYGSAMQINTWDAVKASRPEYESLPDYGTPEFKTAYDATLKDFPSIAKMDRAEGLKLTAKLMSGGKPTREEAQKLVDAGKKQAVQQTRKVTASKALGAGRSKGEFTPKSTDNPLRDGILAYMQGQKSGKTE